MNSVSPRPPTRQVDQHGHRLHRMEQTTKKTFKYENSLMCDYELDGNFILLFFILRNCTSMLHPSFRRAPCCSHAAVQAIYTHTHTHTPACPSLLSICSHTDLPSSISGASVVMRSKQRCVFPCRFCDNCEPDHCFSSSGVFFFFF